MSTVDESPVRAFPIERAAGRRPGGRRRPMVLTAALAAVGALVLSGCGAFSSYAAEVNGERITQKELRRELNAILGNEKYLDRVDESFSGSSGGQEKVRGAGKGTFNTVFVAAVLDRRIGFTLIHQEVARRKLTVSADLRNRTRAELEENYTKEIFEAFPEDYRDELVRIFAEQALLQEVLGTGLDDAAVRDFYEANKAAFERTCPRHILVGNEEQAASVKARVDAGGDFAAIAKAESTDNQVPIGSAQKGGDLGCPPDGSLVPEFEEAARALQPGETSEPVQTQFGFHVIQVVERKTLTLEEATPEILEVLQRQAPNPIETYVTKALGTADIKVNPRYGTFVKEPNPGVRAPKLLEPSTTTSIPGLPEPQTGP